MTSSRVVWGSAIFLSLLTHAGAAVVLSLSPEPEAEVAQIAGGVVAEVAMLGNSAFDAVESGEPEKLEPTDESAPETIKPAQQQVAAIEPQGAPEQVMPVENVVTPEADEIVPEMSEAIAIQGAAVEIAAIPLPDIKPEITDKPPVALKPLEKVVKKPVEKVPEKKVETKKPKAGEKGNSARAASKGQADGSKDVKTASLGGQKKGNVSAAGNAAMSNYPGKVRNKINRAKRRVAGVGGGVATVSFTVSASGQASGIRISTSSGLPELDQAALDAVRRAAPFPAIPADAGRSSWPFSVPIAFKR